MATIYQTNVRNNSKRNFNEYFKALLTFIFNKIKLLIIIEYLHHLHHLFYLLLIYFNKFVYLSNSYLFPIF
jgi:hypothetical protein